MEVSIIEHYTDIATGVQKGYSMSLSDSDGKDIFSEHWAEWDAKTRFRKLASFADIAITSLAVDRGYRSEETAADQIKKIVRTDFSD